MYIYFYLNFNIKKQTLQDVCFKINNCYYEWNKVEFRNWL